MTARSTVGALLVAALLTTASQAMAQRAPAGAPTKLSPEVLALACAPKAVFEEPARPLRITGGQASFVRYTHAPGDLVTINAGSENGIQVGQEFYTRRLLTSPRTPVSRTSPITVITSGWIRVWAVDDKMSLATITHACDSIEIDDHLEPFVLPTVPTISDSKAKPQRDNYGHVVSGLDQRRMFGKGDFFLLDRGSDHGIAPGATFVLYRNKGQDKNFLYELGEAVAVDVSPETSTLQVIVFRDAILEGDLVALRK